MLPNKTVLIVDRAFLVADTLAATLEKQGYSVYTETVYTGALRELEALPLVDLLIAHSGSEDDVDGIGFLTFALSEHPRLPVVVITGLPKHEVRLPPGRWVHLQKPFDTEALLLAMRAAEALLGVPRARAKAAAEPHKDPVVDLEG